MPHGARSLLVSYPALRQLVGEVLQAVPSQTGGGCAGLGLDIGPSKVYHAVPQKRNRDSGGKTSRPSDAGRSCIFAAIII